MPAKRTRDRRWSAQEAAATGVLLVPAPAPELPLDEEPPLAAVEAVPSELPFDEAPAPAVAAGSLVAPGGRLVSRLSVL